MRAFRHVVLCGVSDAEAVFCGPACWQGRHALQMKVHLTILEGLHLSSVQSCSTPVVGTE
jgi:hypothetical protein